MTSTSERIRELVEAEGLTTLPEPVQLASGQMSRYFIDGKRALRRGADLNLVCRAILDLARSMGIEWDAVGGLTMGADHFAHAVASLAGDHHEWFSVRKAPKGRGTNKLLEGGDPRDGARVLLVDDVVTTGGSIRQAYEAVRANGATVVLAVTLVDRGEVAKRFFAEVGVPYRPLLTYHDLGIPEVGTEDLTTAGREADRPSPAKCRAGQKPV